MSTDIALARKMQLELLPTADHLRRLDALGLSVDSVFEPSSAIGGDIWGVLPSCAGGFGVYIADFAGHGVGAALDVFRLQSLISALNPRQLGPAGVLARLNATLHAILPRGMYATMLVCLLDLDADELVWSAAGTPRPLLIRPGQDPDWLDSRGSPLGLRRAATYRTHRAALPPGSGLLLYSDALSEATDPAGVAIDEAGILEIMRDAPPGMAMRGLLPALAERGALPLRDDLTAIHIVRHVARAA